MEYVVFKFSIYLPNPPQINLHSYTPKLYLSQLNSSSPIHASRII